ncbi:MAG: hypothetical protein GC168_08715 [Candidatus Hydrogenedens sp.]|nr:hypothetical protein [Candidatus Hydrogenedens sp.]
MTSPPPRFPVWPWAVIVALALTQPALHYALQSLPPEGTAFSGLSIADSALFLESMERGVALDFHSPYATCKSAWGDADPRFYAVPHLWLYAALGLVCKLTGLEPFTLLGLANGAAFGFYLAMVWRFLRHAVPHYAAAAFALFTLSGGPGGLLFLASRALGWDLHPGFDAAFFRWALYGLMEGPHFSPLLYAPRCYYTLSLGIGFGALAAVARGLREERAAMVLWWLPALLLGAFLYARAGVFFGAILLFMLAGTSAGFWLRLRCAVLVALPMAAGMVMSALVLRTNPQVVANHLEAASMAMWLTPALVVCALPLAAAAPALRAAVQSGGWLPSFVLRAGLGYLAAYAIAAIGYMAYYGTLAQGPEGSVAAAVSDWALIGLLAGLWPRAAGSDTTSLPPWWAWWLVAFLALSLSGFGQGWFLQFGPQRLQMLVWLPLCVLAAVGLAQTRPVVRRLVWTLLLLFGISSIGVSLVFFQTSYGRTHAQGAFAAYHPEAFAASDARALDLLPDGMLLAPAPMSDIAVRRTGSSTVYGVGTFNLTDVDYVELKREVQRFFSPEATDTEREAFARAWCADYILCPATWPSEAAETLRAAAWTQVIYDDGGTLLLEVIPEASVDR